MFSICIPNFNYSAYLPATLDSVLTQDFSDLEVVISDNCSTDESVELIERYAASDSRVRFRVNRRNVGFFGNLDRAAQMAKFEWMNMLSSDDLMNPAALSTISRVIDALGASADATVLTTAEHVIDANGRELRERRIDRSRWGAAQRDEKLSRAANADVWVNPSGKLLASSLRLLRSPLYFASTVYPKRLYNAVEGYSQGGLVNPDKRFAWSLLTVAEQAVFIDAPLFSYRWHDANQTAQQEASGALKHLVDQYTATFTLPPETLERAGLDKHDLARAFVEQDVVLRGFRALSEGNSKLAKRMIAFGDAAYPDDMARNRKAQLLRLAVRGGPLAQSVARRAFRPLERRWRRSVERDAGALAGGVE